MAAECLAAIHLCRVRATRLNADGSIAAGPNNVYTTDKPMTLTVTPVVQAGDDKTLVGGCDCLIAEYRGYDKLKRFDLELDIGVLEIGLLELMLGSTVISAAGSPIGQWWTDQAFDCSGHAQPNVAIEGWQIAQHTLQNDFNQPRLTGFTRGNPTFGLGPFGDLPEAAGKLGGFFYSATIPAASCGYTTVAAT